VNLAPLFQTRQTTTLPPHHTSQTTIPSHSPEPTSSCPDSSTRYVHCYQNGLKANKPTEFTGSYTKSEEFLQECETYIELTKPTTSDRAKIAFVLTYLKGPAPSAWKRQYIISTYNQTDSLARFKEHFNAAYGDPNKKSNALTKLERLYQGKCPSNSI